MAISRAANDSKLLLRDDFWAPDSMLPGTPFLRRRHYFDFPECVRASSAPWLWTDNCSAWVCWQYIRETILLRPFHFSFPARESRREKNSRADRRERHVRLPQPPLAGDPAGCASYNDRLYRKSDPRTWDAARALSGIQHPPRQHFFSGGGNFPLRKLLPPGPARKAFRFPDAPYLRRHRPFPGRCNRTQSAPGQRKNYGHRAAPRFQLL